MLRIALQPVTAAGARAAREQLSAGERARVAGIGRPRRADAVAVSLALARSQVAAATGLPPAELVFTRTCERCGHPTHGRPRLSGDGPEFSVSRSERWAAVAVAAVPVGVDVEDPGRPVDADDLAPILTGPERRWAAGRPGEDLLALWVLKEAVGKARRTGIVAAHEFSVAGGVLRGWRTVGGCSATLLDAPGAVLAVAVQRGPEL